MYIKQSRVINVKKYLVDFQKGSSICVGLKLDDASTRILSDKLKIDRFTLQEGDAIFPGPEHGICTEFCMIFIGNKGSWMYL